MQHLLRTEVDDAHRVVAQLGNKQAPVLDIDGQMIDASGYAAEWNFRFERNRHCAAALLRERRSHPVDRQATKRKRRCQTNEPRGTGAQRSRPNPLRAGAPVHLLALLVWSRAALRPLASFTASSF